MVRQRRRDTAPEQAIRRALHAAGLRYRIDVSPLPGFRRRADVVFTRRKLAVFVDGCFWHSCPLHATSPKANNSWWTSKLEANVQRDRDTDLRLREAGWTVIRVWEHENPLAAAAEIARVVREVPAGKAGAGAHGQ
jgi:DNA mismatch endonuclease, patch repair protein